MTPHPVTDPAGHSYRTPGAAEPAQAAVDLHQWRANTAYRFGCDLFNHAYWWEAHESFESLWQMTGKRDVPGRFLQGLIHAALAHLKLVQRQPRGVAHFRTRSMRYLAFARQGCGAATCMGLDLDRFIPRFDTYINEVTRGPAEEWTHDIETFPYLVLEFEDSAAGPKVR